MAKHQECITDVIEEMKPEEKGMLKSILLYGKEFQEKAGEIISSPDELEKYCEDVTCDWVSTQLNDIFIEGLGIMDALDDISCNYGKQLDVTIKEVLVESLKVTKPMFSKDVNTVEGAIQRERWITEKLMDSLITNMDDDYKKEMAEQIAEMLKEKGIDPSDATRAGIAIITGGLTATRAVLGFRFHILVAQIANIIVKSMIGRGLPLILNAALQRVSGFLFHPVVGGIITLITAFPLITSFVNSRDYEKYILAIFIIGVTRISHNSKNILPPNEN